VGEYPELYVINFSDAAGAEEYRQRRERARSTARERYHDYLAAILGLHSSDDPERSPTLRSMRFHFGTMSTAASRVRVRAIPGCPKATSTTTDSAAAARVQRRNVGTHWTTGAKRPPRSGSHPKASGSGPPSAPRKPNWKLG